MANVNEIRWCKEDLNENELKTGYVSYRNVVKRFVGDIVLCNEIVNVDPECVYNNLVGSIYDEERDEYTEVFQWCLCNLTKWDIDWLNELDQDDLIILHSDLLDVDILAVTHWGTSWDYVETSFPTNLDKE